MENKYIKTILKEMCQVVGADYSKIDFKKKFWYEEYTWTEKEQDGFLSWLEKYVYKPEVWKEVVNPVYRRNKKNAKKFAENFLFYCWKCNYDK